jgi:hypothetical protein
MRKTTLAVVISSVLLGAVAAQAEPAMDPTQAPSAQTSTPTTSPTDTSKPAGTAPSQDADTDPDADSNESVGSAESNVDEKSSSGSYYPYSAGTVGDDPAEPKSTSPTAGTGPDAGPTDQWIKGDADGDGYLSKDELTKLSPTLAGSFEKMDVDKDEKLSRGEFRTWRESQKAKMDADQPTGSSASDGHWSSTSGSASAPSTTDPGTMAPSNTTTPSDTTAPSNTTTPSTTTAPGSTTMPDDTAAPDDKRN